MKNWLFFPLVFMLSAHYATAAQTKTFIIGVENINYYPLYNFADNNRDNFSFAQELLTRFFRQHGYQFQFLPLPIKRFDKWYVEQGIDFKFPDNVRWREDGGKSLNIKYSAPIVTLMAGSFVVRKNRFMQREQVAQLGTILGFSPSLWFDRIKQGKLSLVEETAPIAVIRHILSGNVKATNIDYNVINHNLARLNKAGEIVLARNMPFETYQYYLSTIRYPKVLAEFNQFLVANQAFITKLKKKYHINENFDQF